MANNKINIEFEQGAEAGEIKVQLSFEGANVMEIAVASLQLQKVVADQIGEEAALELFQGLAQGQTFEQKFPGKPTTEA